MRRSVRVAGLAAAACVAAFALAGCGSGPAGYEFQGTWSNVTLGIGSTWVLGASSGTANANALIFTYSLAFDYVNVDEPNHQITVNVTSASGASTATVGTAYITYSISGGQMMIGISNTAWPTASNGPLTRQ